MSESFGIIMPRRTIITDYGWSAPVATAFDPATTAWVNAVVSAGGTVSSTQKTRVDTLIKALKAHSLWSTDGVLDRLWLHGGESVSQQATIDIVGLATAAVHGTPSLSAGGYTGDATAFYLDSNFNPSTAGGNFAINNSSIGAYIVTSRTIAQNYAAMGYLSTEESRLMGLQPGGAGGLIFEVGDAVGANFVAGQANAQGSFVVSRTGATATSCYQNSNSTPIGTGAHGSGSPSNLNMLLFAANNGGTVIHFSGDQQASEFIGGAMTATQAVNFMNDLNAYMTAWGINVY